MSRRGGGRRSKAKGASFERHVCVVLSKWASGGSRSDMFWRSAMSGGRSRVMGGSKTQSGDISPIDRMAQDLTDVCLIECKHYSDLQIHTLLTGARGSIVRFLTQLDEDAENLGKLPVLIVKQNFQPELVFLPERLWKALSDGTGHDPVSAVFRRSDWSDGFACCRLDDVVAKWDFAMFVETARGLLPGSE